MYFFFFSLNLATLPSCQTRELAGQAEDKDRPRWTLGMVQALMGVGLGASSGRESLRRPRHESRRDCQPTWLSQE